MALYTRT